MLWWHVTGRGCSPPGDQAGGRSWCNLRRRLALEVHVQLPAAYPSAPLHRPQASFLPMLFWLGLPELGRDLVLLVRDTVLLLAWRHIGWQGW